MAQLAALLKAMPVDAAAHQAATSDLNLLRKPTEAQAAAGNYKKGRTRIGGLPVVFENPAGSRRRPEWPPMQAHYGYIERTEGADDDALDVFVKPSTPNDWDGDVHIIDQTDGDGGFDEHKVMLGFDDVTDAIDTYMAHYPPDWELGDVTTMSLDDFKDWLRDGDTAAPVAKLAKDWSQSPSPTTGITAYGNTGPAARKKKRKVRLRPGTTLLRLVAKSWESEARVPAGSSDGGQWTGDGGGGGGTAPTDAAHYGMGNPAGISTPTTQYMASLNTSDLAALGPEAAVQLQSMYRAAADAKPAYDSTMNSIANQVGGKAVLPGLKGSARAVEKITQDYKGDPSKIKDLLRGTIEVGSVAEAQSALKLLQSKFDVLPTGFRNTLDPNAQTIDGYRDIKMNVRMPSGIVAEIQVNVPAMLSAKAENHALYEKTRSIVGAAEGAGRDLTSAERATVDQLNAQMKAAYDKAFQTALTAKP